MYQKAFIVTLLAVAVNQQLHAETAKAQISANDDIPTTTLDELTLYAGIKSGTVLAQKISEMPEVTQVISEKQISQQAVAGRTVIDVLGQLVPSLGTGSGTASNFGMTMHGRPVQYLINGVPLTGSRDISRQINSINPKQLERIEVLSGATSIYGSGATGGLINLVTKSSYQQGLHGESRIGISTNNNFNKEALGYSAGQTVTFGNDKLNARVDVDYESRGGRFDSDNKRIAPEVWQTDLQDTDSLSVNTNLNYQATPTQNINLAATYYKDQQDTDYAPDYGKGLGVLLKGDTPSMQAIKGLQLDNQPFTKKSTVSLNYNNSDIKGSNLNVTGYYRQEDGRYYPTPAPISIKPAYPLIDSLAVDNATKDKYKKKLANSAYSILQSTADINVMGLRAAMQTPSTWQDKKLLWSYGADFERETDKQHYDGNDLKTFIDSNGLKIQPNNTRYTAGPNSTIDKVGAFVNLDADVTDKWHVSGGVRHQNITSKTDAFTTRNEAQLQDLLAQFKLPYQAGSVPAGETKHNKTLFNLGTSYNIAPQQKIFANFSQGFNLPDIQRLLRDVNVGFKVNSDTVAPIAVNNYELGWQGDFDKTKAKVVGFYNTSDKVVQFTKDFNVIAADTDERIYGAEASINHRFNQEWSVGSSLAYTKGEYKDAAGAWRDLGAFRVTPLKATAYAQYTFPQGNSLRLQGTAIGGTDKAYNDMLVAAVDKNISKSREAKITGYATLDLLGQVKLGKGDLAFGVYNIGNTRYRSVFNQSAEAIAGPLAGQEAQGRTYGLQYSLNWF